MDALLTAALVGTATSLVSLRAALWPIDRHLDQLRHDVARFPLYATRARLIGLVASGQMSESDPAWSATYRSVTRLLHPEGDVNAVQFLWKFASNLRAIGQDPKLRESFNKHVRMIRDAEKRVPEFAQVHDQLDDALRHMVVRRTTAPQLALLVLIATALNIYLLVGGTPRFIAGKARRSPRAEDLTGLELTGGLLA